MCHLRSQSQDSAASVCFGRDLGPGSLIVAKRPTILEVRDEVGAPPICLRSSGADRGYNIPAIHQRILDTVCAIVTTRRLIVQINHARNRVPDDSPQFTRKSTLTSQSIKHIFSIGWRIRVDLLFPRLQVFRQSLKPHDLDKVTTEDKITPVQGRQKCLFAILCR
jgi:hypothetical protein